MAGNTNHSFVIDSSFLLAYLLPDENIKSVQDFFDRVKVQQITLIAPVLLPFEVLNGLKAGVLSKRLSKETAVSLSRKFIQLPIALQETAFLEVFKFSLDEKLSFYDAAYLYLARTSHLPLLTLDKQLNRITS